MADINAKVLSSKKPLTDIPIEWRDKSFIEVLFTLIEKSLEKKADQAWLIDAETGEKLALKELHSRVLEAAQALRLKGLKKGDIVHILLPNSIQFHATVFGVWLLGGIASLADPSLNDAVLKKQIIDTKTKMVICNEKNLTRVRALAGDTVLVSSIDWFRKRSDGTKDGLKKYFSELSSSMQDNLVIFWSSGTTGKPKVINDGRDTFLVISSAYYDRTFLWSADIFTSVWQENF